MRMWRKVQHASAMAALLGVAFPQLAFATDHRAEASAPSAGASLVVHDVGLTKGGVLRGQLVDPQGLPLQGASIAMQQQNEILETATTNRDGQFMFNQVRGGVYALSAGNTTGMYRLWAQETAPPNVKDSVLLVSGGDAVRGEGPGLRAFVTNPWVIMGVIATAIAVPIAVHNHNKNSGS